MAGSSSPTPTLPARSHDEDVASSAKWTLNQACAQLNHRGCVQGDAILILCSHAEAIAEGCGGDSRDVEEALRRALGVREAAEEDVKMLREALGVLEGGGGRGRGDVNE